MLRLKHKKAVITLILLLHTFGICFAEYNHEIGAAGGVSFYLGDANHKTPFHRPRMAVGGFYRYNIDTRWALKLKVSYCEIEGDTRDFGYKFPNGQEYAAFERGFVDVSLGCEINFLDIGESKYYKAKYKATPYIIIGLGLTAYSDLYSGTNMYNINIPVGIGGKWRINKRWTLGLEWTIHKLFTDKLDVTSANSAILNDPYKTGKVGFFDTDFYSMAQLYISFNLFDTRKFCR